MRSPEKRLPHIGTYKNLGNRKRYGIIVVQSKKGKYQDMTRLFDIAACRALHMSRPQPPKISIGIEISQPPMDGGLSSIQRKMNIGGEPHKLGYLNFKEDKMLKDMGALGEPVEGTQGIPAYYGVSYTDEEAGYTDPDDVSEGHDKAIAGEGYMGTGPGYGVPDTDVETAYKDWEKDYDYRAAAPMEKAPEGLTSIVNFLSPISVPKHVIDALYHGWKTSYWGALDVQGRQDDPEYSKQADMETNIDITPKKKKAKEKEKEKEKSAMEKYLDSIAGRDDDDSDDDDVSERQKWWDDLPDYLKDILRNTYPEEGKGGMPKDLFTDSV